MNVDTDVIKETRIDKNWTQQQLADICGLNLRTIQRIEKTGFASKESVSSISVAFEIKKVAFVLQKSVASQMKVTHKIKEFMMKCYVSCLPMAAFVLFFIGVFGLIQLPLDSRVWLLIVCLVSSGVFITISMLRKPICKH